MGGLLCPVNNTLMELLGKSQVLWMLPQSDGTRGSSSYTSQLWLYYIGKGSELLLKSDCYITWPLPPFPRLWTEPQCPSICPLVCFVGLRDHTIPTGIAGPCRSLARSLSRMDAREEIFLFKPFLYCCALQQTGCRVLPMLPKSAAIVRKKTADWYKLWAFTPPDNAVDIESAEQL